MMGGYGMGGYGAGLGGGILGLLYMFVPLLVLGGIIYFAVKAATHGSTKAANPMGGHKPVNIAEERYAKGEISLEDLKEIRNNLKA